MRGLVRVLGTLGAGAVIALGMSQSAYAAQGSLTVSGNTYQNPSGCYSGRYWPLIVQNDTDEYALIYDGQNCTGQVISVVPPGGSETQEFGSSVSIQ